MNSCTANSTTECYGAGGSPWSCEVNGDKQCSGTDGALSCCIRGEANPSPACGDRGLKDGVSECRLQCKTGEVRACTTDQQCAFGQICVVAEITTKTAEILYVGICVEPP